MDVARTLDPPAKPPREMLNSVSAVIDALGGTGRVLALTGIGTYQQLSVCKVRGTLPAKYYLVMIDALHERGYDAAGDLWGMARPERPMEARGG